MRKYLLAFALLVLCAGALAPAAHAQLIDAGITQQQDNAFRSAAGYTPASRLSLSLTIATFIRYLLSFLGVIFVVLTIYAGMLWMTSAGNEEKIDKAKKILTAAVIGLIIVLSAYAITYFVIDQLLLATQGQRLY